jgi:hypothetical protein
MSRKHATASSRNRKVPRTYRLAPGKVAAAQRLLGAATATEAIETALDLIVFRRELVSGTRAMLGVRITPLDETVR